MIKLYIPATTGSNVINPKKKALARCLSLTGTGGAVAGDGGVDDGDGEIGVEEEVACDG